jgi:ParB family chromosome partitioning protein
VAEAQGGRRGLGRGLAALLGDEGAPAAAAPALLELPLDAIRPNPDQPRAAIGEEALRALADSIAESGLMQPVVVRPAGEPGGYELIAGERRWRAARAAGLDRIPALVREADPRERLELALVENLVREDLNPIEVAQACACLVEDFGQGPSALAARLGRSRPAISNLMRLLELPEDVQELVAAGRLTEGHGRAILMADGARARRRVAERAVAEELSVRATEALARRSAPPDAARRERAAPALAEEAGEGFSAAFDAPARVRAGARGAVVVELRFPDEAALAAALARLPRREA